MHDSLGDILKKIGTKETTKEGLVALYNFRLKHKDVDIEPFLEQTSDFFQKYIARGLKTIEDERKIDNTENIEVRHTTA
ncbi:cytoskeleton-associated protein 5-like [Xenia sp. Carnegie-2017]|uniref:cytoskeleton-associated protein 5-like n=1 Tax=Xenia sp. Carnegie-2017 TaxID=2897299 RepID=UPI001F033A10|nr:cytoskeleton-associated protein 5-like [Xenia sp. Carnegie-2017]